MDLTKEPVHNVEWREAATLMANSWNPNVVFTPELRLLVRSILKNGWIQPVIINPDGMIIDGFHRASLARDEPQIVARYGGKVPCVVMPLSKPQAMIVTIRMNRAKGSHVAVRMAEIVKALIDEHGLDAQEVADELGATRDEVQLLYQDGVFKMKNIKDYKYSKAWVPHDTRLKA